MFKKDSVMDGLVAAQQQRQRFATVYLLGLFLLVWVAAWAALDGRAAYGEVAGVSATLLDGCVDPNTAPWHELTVLPRVGEQMARRIVEFREESALEGVERPFRRAEDLERVHGIGPKTAAQMASLLRFERFERRGR